MQRTPFGQKLDQVKYYDWISIRKILMVISFLIFGLLILFNIGYIGMFWNRIYETKFKHINNEYSPNALISANATGSSGLRQPLERPLNFLSAKIAVGNYTAYKFWQFSDWRVADGTNSRRGIDRFLYIPELGIVGGSFDFWFNALGISSKEIMKNYLSEDVILPVSINNH